MKLRHILPLVAALTAFAPAAQAAVIGIYTNNYGIGSIEPSGHTVTPNGVVVSETDPTPFIGSFDFSDLAGSTIDRLTLSLEFTGAGPNSQRFTFTVLGRTVSINLPTERWFLDIAPGTGSPFQTVANTLVDGQQPLTRSIDAATDTLFQETAFADAVANLSLDFGFADAIFYRTNSFTLQSATLTVEGSLAVVPLPAGFWLLLTATGGLILRSRGQTKRFQTASNLS